MSSINVLASSVKATTCKAEDGTQTIELEETYRYIQTVHVPYDDSMKYMSEADIIALIARESARSKEPFQRRFVSYLESMESRNVIRQYRILKHAPTMDFDQPHYDHYR